MQFIGVLAPLLAAALTGLGVALLARRYRADERSDPETALTLERLRRAGIAVGWLLGIAVGLPFDAPTAWGRVVTVVAPAIGTDTATTLGAALAIAVPGLLAAGAARVGTLASQRRVERVTPTYRDALRFELERETALLVGFTFAVLLVLVVPSGWPRITAAVSLGGVATAATPAWLILTQHARRPTADEAAAVDGVLPEDIRLLVVESRLAGPSAVAAGILPGPRYVFVDGALFDLLGDREVRAVVAHEVGHHRHHHIAMRYGLLVGGVGPLLLVAEFAPRLIPPAVPLAGGYALVALAALRRMELTADEAADGPALADALASLAERGYLRPDPSGPARLLAVHPRLPERVRRFRTGAQDR